MATLDEAYARVIQGNGPLARAALASIDPDTLNEADRNIKECMMARLSASQSAAPQVLDPWTAKLLRVYVQYWTRSLETPAEVSVYEKELVRELRMLLPSRGNERLPMEMSALEPMMQAQLRRIGLYGWFGITRPLREFMLWRTQSESSYEVDLPMGKESVNVSILDGFISFGWVGFATCDQRHVAGWTTPDHLYAVGSSYDMESEAFRVGFLAHESQHFADLREYPGIDQEELEYRAKLAELTLREETLRWALNQFLVNRVESGAAPHSVANFRVMRDLACELLQSSDAEAMSRIQAVPVDAIHATARKLLLAHKPVSMSDRERP